MATELLPILDARYASQPFVDAAAANKMTLLRPFKAKMALRNSAPVNILCLGDSTVEGARCTNAQTRWQGRLQDMLRARLGQSVTGGFGYVPSWYSTGDQQTPSPSQFSSSISHTGSGQSRGTYGFGRRCLAMNPGDVSTLTIPATGPYKSTSVDVMWAKAATSATSIVIKLDGTQVYTTTTNSGSPAGAQTYRVAIPQDSAQHVITVEVTGQVLYFEGWFLYNSDESSGIRVIDGAASGAPSSWFAYTSASSGGNQNFMLDNVLWATPALITLMVGINDFYNSTAQLATPAQYLANLQTAISNIRAKLVGQVPPIIIMRQYERGPTGSTASLPYQWAAYSEAIDQLIAADPTLLLYDFEARMPPGVQTSALGLINSIDLTHLTDTGGGYLADDFVSFLIGS